MYVCTHLEVLEYVSYSYHIIQVKSTYKLRFRGADDSAVVTLHTCSQPKYEVE